MVMLGGGADILGALVVPGGGDGAWPELAGRVEQRAAQVLQQPQAVRGHGQAAPAAGSPVRGAGIVMRCPNCDNAVAKIVKGDTRMWINFGGMQALEITL